MKNNHIWSRIILLSILVVMLFTSCRSSGPTEEDVSVISTQAAQTVMAEMSSADPNATLKPADSKEPDPTNTLIPTNIPVKKYGNRSNPFPVGSLFEGTSEKTMTFTLIISDVLRGEQAYKMIMDANMFNDEPEEGQEYLLAYGNLNFVESADPDSLLELDEYYFASVSNNRIVDNPFAVSPEPTFDCKLFVGGTCEGWITLAVYEDDPSPLIRFGKSYDGKKFYFATH